MTASWFNVAQAFRNVVDHYADRKALAFDENQAMTYRQLDLLSNQAAHFMRYRGVRKGDRIALSLEKCPSAYALILAALKIGAIYVALDPRNPAARRKSILAQCTPTLIFSEHPLDDGDLQAASVLCPEKLELPAFCRAFSEAAISEDNQCTGSDPAYIMFTSGSTGAPKGAVISHDNLLHFIGWAQNQYGFTPNDIHTHLNPLYFDNSVFDIYSTLFTGGMLVPFDSGTLQNPTELVARLKAMRCTVWFSVPSLLIYLQVMKAATRANLGSLRRIIFGGEGFPKPKLKQLFDELGAQAELHNVYGPTECTCICSSYQLSADDFLDVDGLPPLGVLNQHFTQHILDGNLSVPDGEVGELCLGGCCVGLGYYNSPGLNATAFIQNPSNGAFREIIYRTGDLVRLDPRDRKLHFIGRRDLQIKHMGYRIELEEIQHALIRLDGIDEVIALHKQSSGISEIIAIAATSLPLKERDLRGQLSKYLPHYMIPSKIHVIAQMPKTPNGKTDRQKLVCIYAT